MKNKQIHKMHGLSKHPLYMIWVDMIRRCYHKDRNAYKFYGAKGISVCDEWLDISNFVKDMEDSYHKNMTIDRINPKGNYCKENCRWLSKSEQQSNKSNNVKFKGETATQASKRLGGNRNTVRMRTGYMGWSLEKAFTTPIRHRKLSINLA